MEILVELLAEFVLGLGLLGVAYAVGSVVFLLVRAARRCLRGLNPVHDVVDPEGRHWAVRVGLAPPPLRYRFSAWYFRMRPSDQARRTSKRDLPVDGVDRHELAHPSGLVEQFEEGGGVIVWPILALTVVAVVVLVVEVLLVATVAAVVCVVRTLTSRWQCEVIGPSGQHFHVPAGSLQQARDERERLRQEIAAGVVRVMA